MGGLHPAKILLCVINLHFLIFDEMQSNKNLSISLAVYFHTNEPPIVIDSSVKNCVIYIAMHSLIRYKDASRRLS